jgi:hypothetical protein
MSVGRLAPAFFNPDQRFTAELTDPFRLFRLCTRADFSVRGEPSTVGVVSEMNWNDWTVETAHLR